MRPTQAQVTRSLAALNGAGQRTLDGRFGQESGVANGEDVSAEVIRALRETPEIRSDLLEEARGRLRAGERPSADALADSMLGRFICDRLR